LLPDAANVGHGGNFKTLFNLFFVFLNFYESASIVSITLLVEPKVPAPQAASGNIRQHLLLLKYVNNKCYVNQGRVFKTHEF
jgi:hypothetical protein